MANQTNEADFTQGVLRNDGIHHSIFPVQSWSQIKTIFREQINEGEVSLACIQSFYQQYNLGGELACDGGGGGAMTREGGHGNWTVPLLYPAYIVAATPTCILSGRTCSRFKI